jgi:hypothetical protein
MKEQVKEEEGREFAQKIGAIFRLTSAKNGEGIKEMFNVIGKKYLDSILNKNKIINNQCDNDFDNKKNIVLIKSNFNNNENIKNKKKCKC